jgi:histidine triad (HIT) family protein
MKIVVCQYSFVYKTDRGIMELLIQKLKFRNMECLFCKIIAGEIPSNKIYEDDQTFAFLDIAPCNPGHTLVITKEHYSNLEEVPKEVLSHLISSVKMVGALIKDRLMVSGYNVQINNDPVAGQVIPHLHFHIIPRHENDGHKLWRQGKYLAGEAEEIIKKLIS